MELAAPVVLSDDVTQDQSLIAFHEIQNANENVQIRISDEVVIGILHHEKEHLAIMIASYSSSISSQTVYSS